MARDLEKRKILPELVFFLLCGGEALCCVLGSFRNSHDHPVFGALFRLLEGELKTARVVRLHDRLLPDSWRATILSSERLWHATHAVSLIVFCSLVFWCRFVLDPYSQKAKLYILALLLFQVYYQLQLVWLVYGGV